MIFSSLFFVQGKKDVPGPEHDVLPTHGSCGKQPFSLYLYNIML